MTQRDFYQVLGIARDAAPADIRAAFVRLAKHHHPDHAQNAGGLSGRLHEVQQAYRSLSDADTRAAHDRTLAETERLHFARQRSVQRRLRRYGGRHPRLQPHGYRYVRWRSLLLVALGAAIVARVSLGLIG